MPSDRRLAQEYADFPRMAYIKPPRWWVTALFLAPPLPLAPFSSHTFRLELLRRDRRSIREKFRVLCPTQLRAIPAEWSLSLFWESYTNQNRRAGHSLKPSHLSRRQSRSRCRARVPRLSGASASTRGVIDTSLSPFSLARAPPPALTFPPQNAGLPRCATCPPEPLLVATS